MDDHRDLELLERCLAALAELVAVDGWTSLPGHSVGGLRVGAALEVWIGGNRFEFAVEIKRGYRDAHLGPLLHRARRLDECGATLLLCTERVSRDQSTELRRAGVGYVDLGGNAHLRAPGLYVLVEGRPAVTAPPPGRLRGTEVRLLGVFLRDRDAGHRIQQELAERAGIALGAVGRARSRLEEARVITRMDERRWRVSDRALGLGLFADGWAAVVRPKLEPTTYRSLARGGWSGAETDVLRSIPDDLGCLLGGEQAAALLTRGLFTEYATLHVEREHRHTLAKLLGLAPDRDGPITMLDRFGRGDEFLEHEAAPGLREPRLIHPLLVWAECLTISDERVVRVAEDLRERFIEEPP